MHSSVEMYAWNFQAAQKSDQICPFDSKHIEIFSNTNDEEMRHNVNRRQLGPRIIQVDRIFECKPAIWCVCLLQLL